MAFQSRIVFVSLAFLLIPVASRSQQAIFEAPPGVDELSACDFLHHVVTCDSFHIETSSVAVGTKLNLGGTVYVVEWMGPGYYLESGLVLELMGEVSAGLKNQRWFEVYPKQGKIHISSSWQDGDRNQRLSIADTLTLEDGRALHIRDVRLHVRASPAPKQ
ncbi:MAG TPA: hypothetical protein VLV54_10640 [Thermoanaerobaculia bacterium]|nr:hypothetical protein [Thermoanaerobaculia bacterium]